MLDMPIVRQSLKRVASNKFDKAMTDILMLDGLPMAVVFGKLCNESAVVTDDWTMTVMRQLVWAVGQTIEMEVLEKAERSARPHGSPPAPLGGNGGNGSNDDDDDDDTEMMCQSLVYDSRNWRHTDREERRYLDATKLSCEGSRCFSMAGPDGSKVGTDLGIFGGAIMGSKKRKVAVCPWQVCYLVC